MKNKLLNNLEYLFCVGLGFLNFIFLAIPYVSSFYSYDLGEWGGKQSSSEGISGYEVMKLWDGGFGGVMSSLIQIFELIFAIAMLAYGIVGLLKNFELIKEIPSEVDKLIDKKYGKFALYIYSGINVLLLIFLIILCISNTKTESELGYSASAGIRLSAGIFITLVFAIGSIVTIKVLQTKFKPDEDQKKNEIIYLCSRCGMKQRKKTNFCPDCGGEIKECVIED